MFYFRNSEAFPFKGREAALKEGLGLEAVEDAVSFPCLMLSTTDLKKSKAGMLILLAAIIFYLIIHTLLYITLSPFKSVNLPDYTITGKKSRKDKYIT